MVNTLQANITTLGNVAKYINGRAFKPSEWEETGLPIFDGELLYILGSFRGNSDDFFVPSTLEYSER